jgi:hypothetical protein
MNEKWALHCPQGYITEQGTHSHNLTEALTFCTLEKALMIYAHMKPRQPSYTVKSIRVPMLTSWLKHTEKAHSAHFSC